MNGVGGDARTPNPRLTYAITVPGLAACVLVAASFQYSTLLDPLTIALAACAICASTAYVPLEGKLLVDASFVPLMLAIAFLDPASALAIVAASELGAWTIQRYRPAVVPINLFSVGAVTLAGATAFSALDLSLGISFYLALAAVGGVTLLINDLLITTLIGILDGSPIRSRLAGHLKLVPALAINVALALAAVNIYASSGLEAVLFISGLIVAFNYMVRQTVLARARAQRVEELATSRGHLVAHTLNAEARERRALAEALHDGTMQALVSARQDLNDAARGEPGAIDRARAALDAAVRELRATIFVLHPTVVDRAGLVGALEQIVGNANARCSFDATVSVAPEAAGVDDQLVLSLARELVANAVNHSSASSLTVSVARHEDAVVLEVADDGVGFDEPAREAALADGHIGLASCVERCDARGGRFLIETAPGAGTRITAVIPADAGAASARPRQALQEMSSI